MRSCSPSNHSFQCLMALRETREGREPLVVEGVPYGVTVVEEVDVGAGTVLHGTDREVDALPVGLILVAHAGHPHSARRRGRCRTRPPSYRTEIPPLHRRPSRLRNRRSTSPETGGSGNRLERLLRLGGDWVVLTGTGTRPNPRLPHMPRSHVPGVRRGGSNVGRRLPLLGDTESARI